MNETKTMTLMEAWKKVPLKHTIGVEDSFAHGFAAGREGTLPADRAVEIPEWPGDAKALVWQWQYHGAVGPLNTIPRPQPVWTPRVGEYVFVSFDGEKAHFGIHLGFSKGNNNDTAETKAFGKSFNGGYEVNRDMEKPFSESAIGKSWDQI